MEGNCKQGVKSISELLSWNVEYQYGDKYEIHSDHLIKEHYISLGTRNSDLSEELHLIAREHEYAHAFLCETAGYLFSYSEYQFQNPRSKSFSKGYHPFFNRACDWFVYYVVNLYFQDELRNFVRGVLIRAVGSPTPRTIDEKLSYALKLALAEYYQFKDKLDNFTYYGGEIDDYRKSFINNPPAEPSLKAFEKLLRELLARELIKVRIAVNSEGYEVWELFNRQMKEYYEVY